MSWRKCSKSIKENFPDLRIQTRGIGDFLDRKKQSGRKNKYIEKYTFVSRQGFP